MQRGGAARHAQGERAVVAQDIFVRIPVAAREAIVVATPDLHEAHAALEEAAGGEALLGKGVTLSSAALDGLRATLRAAASRP
jgi:hypothetical protein